MGKRSRIKIDRLIDIERAKGEVWDECLIDAADRSTNCFLSDQDESAKLFRDQLRFFRRMSKESSGRVCDLLLERNNDN